MSPTKKLAVNVTALDDDGRMVTHEAGTTVSAEVAEGITNPKAWQEPEEVSATPEVEEPAAPTKKAAAKPSSK